MKSKMLAVLLLAGSSLFAAPRVVVGIGLGVPLAPAPVEYVGPAPAPGCNWVAGYWYGVGVNRVWRAGYWAHPGVVVAPRHEVVRYYHGYRR